MSVAAGATSTTFTARVGVVSTNQTATLTAAGGGATKPFALSIVPGQWGISGAISALGSGATVALSGAKSATVSTDGSGNFTFTGIANGTYTVTPSKTGYTFSPASKSVTVNGGNVTGITFAVTAQQPPPVQTRSSVVFFGAALQAQGTVGNSAYAGLKQWRMETRIHNLPPTWNGYMYAFGVGNFEIKLLYSTPTDRYLYFEDWTGAGSWCQVDIGGRTDITLRAQKAMDGTETLHVWDSTGTELNNISCFGVRPGPDDFRGSSGGYFTIGGTGYSGVDVLQGDMAYFRFFSTPAAATVGEPQETSSTGDLLDYEFENNLTDSSGPGIDFFAFRGQFLLCLLRLFGRLTHPLAGLPRYCCAPGAGHGGQ